MESSFPLITDLDISVPFTDRLTCIDFFLRNDWQIEGKRMDGFETIRNLTDYDDEIRYFWSFPKGVNFIDEYIDPNDNRKFAYKRETQNQLDYIEVFFDKIEDGFFIYRRDPQVKRHQDKAVLERNGVRYLAPELVMLFKSTNLSEKNIQDFESVFDLFDRDAKEWFLIALKRVNNSDHPWLEQLQDW